MNILLYMGSPHLNGNTAALAKAFQEGAEEAGHEVTVFNVAKMKISGCLACDYCMTKGNGNCIQQDDMQQILPLLKETDMVVFASPIYYFTMSAQIQAAIQRTYCMVKPPKLKYGALLLSSADECVYDGAIAEMRDMMDYFEAENLGVITAFGSENKSDSKLEEVRAFARAL